MERLTDDKMTFLAEKYGYIKVNLPDTRDDYLAGNGEGMWAVVDSQENKDDYDTNKSKGQFHAYLANNSLYYPVLGFGSKIQCEHRGGSRAVAVWELLPDKEEAPANREKVIFTMLDKNN